MSSWGPPKGGRKSKWLHRPFFIGGQMWAEWLHNALKMGCSGTNNGSKMCYSKNNHGPFGGPGGGGGGRSLYATPPPPQVLRDRRLGTARDFFVHASLSSNHACFERQISKTRCYTNVVDCEVKIVHSKLFPGSSAVLKLSRANAGGYIVLSFFLSSRQRRESAIITYIPPYPQTPRRHPPLRYACGSNGSRARPPTLGTPPPPPHTLPQF